MFRSNTLRISHLNVPAPLVVIVGPTAVGKTEIALQLAERLSGEVVSVDSRLFYRGMDIGTAKPTADEQARVPHHLINVADPDETWSLSVFQQAAHAAIQDIHRRGHLPFLVGGTGQYVHAVIHGWELPDQAPDPALRAALEHWAGQVGGDGLHARLAVLDPEAARNIDARNVRRSIRALEVIFRTGQLFSVQRQQRTSPYSLLMVGLKRPRPELYERVDQRIDAMLSTGFVEEVRGLLERGYSPDLPTMSAIGYREIAAYLRGEMSLEGAVIQMKRLTRRFVRHQGAWFSEKNPFIHWFEVEEATVNEIEALIDSDAWIAPGTDLGKEAG
jgi:tRNA dimethylallyltransferase